MKKQLVRIGLISSSILTIGALTMSGVAAAAVYDAGPGSRNYIDSSSSNRMTIRTSNIVNSSNNTNQSAETGSATVGVNTNGGGSGNQHNNGDWYSSWNNSSNSSGDDASSGDTMNESEAETNVEISNDSRSGSISWDNGDEDSSEASISNTGPDSRNSISISSRNSYEETTNNHVDVSSRTTQNARSGSVNVSHNTWGGSTESGDASNRSDSSTNVEFTND